MATTKAYELGQFGGTLDVDSADNVTLTGNLSAKYAGFDSDFTAKSTSDLSEGTNLYYTDARADARADVRIAAATTADLTEGSNLYYTTARSDSDTGVYISGNRTYGNITTTGYIAGPATMTIDPAAVGDNTGTLVIAGNLQVDGTTTTINSTTMEVDDLNLTLASGAANAAAANGAGITVDGASATITYDGTNDEWDFNKDIQLDATNANLWIKSGATGTNGFINWTFNTDSTVYNKVGMDYDTRATTGFHIDAGYPITIDATASGGKAINFAVGGVTKAVLDGTGNVGIGTESPSAKFHVENTAAGTGAYIENDFSWTAANLSEFSNSAFTIRPRTADAYLKTSGSAADIRFQGINAANNASRDILFNPFGGNVGIGLTDPGNALTIARDPGDSRVTLLSLKVTDNDYVNGTGYSHAASIVFDMPSSEAGTRSYRTAAMITGGKDGIADWFTGSASTNFQGALRFHTRQDDVLTEQMRIDADGNVGIGTTDPSYPLHISGTGHKRLKIEKTDAGGDADLQISSPNDSTGWVLFHDNNSGNNSGVIKYVHSANKMHFRTNDVDDRLVISSDGNVGIGTDTPGAGLDVRGSINLRLNNGLLFFTDNNTAGATNVNGGFIGMAHNAGYHVTGNDGGFGSNANSLLIGNYHTGGGDIILATTNAGPYPSGRVIIKEGGNVGIGTDNPERPLTIKGGGEVLRVTSSAATDSHTDFHIDGNEFSIRIDDDNVRSSSVFTLDIDADEKMRIDEYGDMALGSTTAYSTLFVKGGSGSATKKNLTTFATSSLGGSYPDLDTASIVLGSYGGRTATAGNYIAGIAFDHLLNHSSSSPFNYGQNPHGWIGLKMWDFPGYERSSLVFATRPNTTSASEKTIERMEITPYGNVGINRSTPPATLTVNGTQRIEIDSNPSGLYSINSDMHRDGAIIFPVTASITTQIAAAGSGWASMGWATTSRSGEVMHRNTDVRYANGGSGTVMGFYLEAGTGEAGGICLDEDSVQVYGSSDNGTTFRIIDKDSDIVIMEMLQTSWNMSVRGSVNSSQSSFSGLSDRRIKKSFQDVSTENILTKYNNLDLKSYIRIDSYDYMKNNYENEEDLREIGLVAQEVEEIFPDVVGTTPVVDPRGMDSVWEELGEELTEIKNINQTGLLYKTIEAVQALIEENTALKARLDALEE